MGKYQVIYADPPWTYRSGAVSGAAKNHYHTLTDEALSALPVGELADKDCVLFLWTTYPKIEDALKLIKDWGFVYKTLAFVWVKQNKSGNGYFFGLGWWTRSNTEICLLAVKGKPKRKSSKVSQLHFSPVEGHSKKPDEIRDKIVELCGDVPRIELFARQRADGWDCLGNEIDGRDIREAILDYMEEGGTYESRLSG